MTMLALRKFETPWLGARRPAPAKLQFGRMYEDCAVERSAFRPGGKVFCIASAGCTALALAQRGDEVVAVDRNPVQIEYLRARITGSPVLEGALDKSLASIRKALPWLGLSPNKLRTFLALSDPIDQIHYWRSQLDTAAWRGTVDHTLRQSLFRTMRGKQLANVVPSRFGLLLRHRLERCWALHPNRTNPYVWRLLLDCESPAVEAPPAMSGLRLETVCRDAVEFLESALPGTFNGFSLSNILDGTDLPYRTRLLAAMRRASAANAVAVTRSFAEPSTATTNNLAERDRSPFWGVVRVEPLATIAAL